MNLCDCGCDPNKPENCKFCWCVGSPSSFGAKQLCHCCAEVEKMYGGLIYRQGQRLGNTNCQVCGRSRIFQTSSRDQPSSIFQVMCGLCTCVNSLGDKND